MIHKNVNVYEKRGCARGYETKTKKYNTAEQSSYIFIHYIMYIEYTLCILGRNVQLIKVSGHSEQISSRNTTKIVAYNNVKKKNIYQKKCARAHT